jgi:hypothetical protein
MGKGASTEQVVAASLGASLNPDRVFLRCAGGWIADGAALSGL